MTPTLHPYVSRYLAMKKERRDINAHTCQTNRYTLLNFAAFYGRRPVVRLSRADVERWLGVRGGQLNKGSLRTAYGVVRAFCGWLAAEGHVRKDPCYGIRPPRVPRSVRVGYDHGDLARLWPHLPSPRAHAIVALMAGSALRAAEVAHLELGDYDPKTRTVTVRNGKGGDDREEPVPVWAAVKIDAYLDTLPRTGGPLIRSLIDGHSPITPARVVKLTTQWLRSAGIKHGAFDGHGSHAFRRGCARRVVDADQDLRVVQHLLGHAGLTNLSAYIGSIPLAKVRRALEASGGDAA